MKKLIEEFRKFAFGSNVLEMAIGVIMGGAAGKMVSSLVDSVLMPIIGIFLGGKNFSDLSYTFGDAVIKYGELIQSVVDFIIITCCVFFMVKAAQSVKKSMEHQEEKDADPTTDDYLKEIRDILALEKK